MAEWSACAALAEAARPQRISGRTTAHRSGVGRRGVQRPDLVIGWWAVPTILEAGTPEQIDQFVPVHAARRADLVPVVQRAGCRLGSGRPEDESRSGRRWLAAHRAEGVELRGAEGALRVCLARTDPDAPKHKGITYFIVDMKARASSCDRCARSPAPSCSTRCSSTMCSSPTTWWWARSTTAGAWRAPHWPTSGSRWRRAPRWATRSRRCCAPWRNRRSTPRCRTGSANSSLSAQVGSLLDQRIAQLAVGGQDTSAEASARKLIGVRHRQSLAELRMDLTESAGAVRRQGGARLPQHPLPDDRRRHRADPVDDGRRTAAGSATLNRPGCLRRTGPTRRR